MSPDTFAAIFWPAYGLCGVATARFVYGRLRAMAIEDCGLNWIDDADAPIGVFAGTFFGLIVWPLALVCAVIFMNPPKTSEEVKADKERLEKELKEMERKAGLR